jgi:putative hydrolase of the HAD superfamily
MPSNVLFPIDWQNIRHVVLDFGGVLYEIDHLRASDAFAALGFQNFGLEYRHGSQSNIFDQLERGEVSEQEFLDRLKARCDDGTTIEQVKKAWNALLIGLRPDALPWLQSLSRHFDLLLLSNTNAIHASQFEQEILQSKGRAFSQAFRQIIYSHRLGQRKPEVHTYEQVSRDYQLIPEVTLLIDDTKENVNGAIAAGWSAVHLDLTSFSLSQFVRGIGYEDFLNR